MAPTDGQQIATGLTSPCPARAEHGPFYGTQGRQQLTAYATEPPSFPIELGVLWMELTYHGSKFKQANIAASVWSRVLLPVAVSVFATFDCLNCS